MWMQRDFNTQDVMEYWKMQSIDQQLYINLCQQAQLDIQQ